MCDRCKYCNYWMGVKDFRYCEFNETYWWCFDEEQLLCYYSDEEWEDIKHLYISEE